MNRLRLSGCVAVLLSLGTAAPLLAHHRQTPPLVPLTTSGDTALPRLPVWGQAVLFAVDAPGGKTIVVSKIRNPAATTVISEDGDNDDPVANKSSGVVAWDTTGGPGSGRKIYKRRLLGGVAEYLGDPDGTARNPAIDPVGVRIAWEAVVDGTAQVFYRDVAGVRQLSSGAGQSHDPVVGLGGRVVAFDSTSAVGDGHDTGTAQIWVGNPSVPNTVFACITCLRNGAGASVRPAISQDNRALAFQSAADLAGDGHDTGVPQIFLYDTVTKNFARITDDPGGCASPSVQKVAAQGVNGEYRVAYVCGGQPHFYDVKKDLRKHLLVAGDTTGFVTELGNHFFVLTTTADLMAGSGQTQGHRVYLWNQYKKERETPSPIEDLSGTTAAALWFPARGIPAAH